MCLKELKPRGEGGKGGRGEGGKGGRGEGGKGGIHSPAHPLYHGGGVVYELACMSEA